MSLLFRILYAAHARGTHHKLALDALTHLRRADAGAWRDALLAHAERFMAGAKAPDDVFKDFKNHVLHPRDGYWGGAPAQAQRWYDDLVAALARADFSEAAWCAGVLSHYWADPLHPFHTAQSEAENNIHRAVEWSINRDYDALRAEGLKAGLVTDVAMPPGPDWLAEMIKAGASRSNRHYESLIAHYDVTRGVVDPPSGLDPVGRRIIADLLVYGAVGFARILERAIEQSNTSAPEVSLTAATVLATLQVPRQMVLKRIADGADRRQVEAMYDELMATGRVEKNLPAENIVVREAYAAEVATSVKPVPRPIAPEALVTGPVPIAAGPAPLTETVRTLASLVSAPVPPPPSEHPLVSAQPETSTSLPVPLAATSAAAKRRRQRLEAGDAVERAPSIGPKTAERLAAVGIHTVADLLAATPKDVSVRLDVRHITAETVSDWQNQTRLVMALPELCGTDAQLLTGAGYPTVEAIATADVASLCSDLLAFAATERGQRLLRAAAPPDLIEVRAWVLAATLARAA